MKKFLKENFSMVSKIWANHFGMMVFGLMVSVAAGMLSKQFWGGNRIAQIIAGAFAVLLYMFLLYTALWENKKYEKCFLPVNGNPWSSPSSLHYNNTGKIFPKQGGPTQKMIFLR